MLEAREFGFELPEPADDRVWRAEEPSLLTHALLDGGRADGGAWRPPGPASDSTWPTCCTARCAGPVWNAEVEGACAPAFDAINAGIGGSEGATPPIGPPPAGVNRARIESPEVDADAATFSELV